MIAHEQTKTEQRPTSRPRHFIASDLVETSDSGGWTAWHCVQHRAAGITGVVGKEMNPSRLHHAPCGCQYRGDLHLTLCQLHAVEAYQRYKQTRREAGELRELRGHVLESGEHGGI